MGSKRLIVPYILDDDSRDEPFTKDLELASIISLAEARKGTKPLEATIKVRYPLLIKKFEGGSILIDLLGLHQTKLKRNMVPDIKHFVKKLEAVCEEPKMYLDELKGLSGYFGDYSQHETINIGALVNPGKEDELKEFIEQMVDLVPESEPEIFDPLLNKEEINDIVRSIREFRRIILEDQKQLQEARKGLRDTLDIASKVIKEEIQNSKDSGDRKVTLLKESLKKKELKLRKKLDQDIEKIKKRYQKEMRPLKDERTKRRRKVTRTKNRIKTLKKERDNKKLREARNTLGDLEKKFSEIDNVVKILDSDINNKIRVLRTQFNNDLDAEKKKIKETQKETQNKIKEFQSLDKALNEEAKKRRKEIDALIRKKEGRIRSIDNYRIDLNIGDIEINIPFYAYQFGGKKYDYYPPVEVIGSVGLFTRFRRMLADGLEKKINTLIKPQECGARIFIEKLVREFGRKTPVGKTYSEHVVGLNLLRKKESLHLMMIGLTKMRRGGWISNDEYIRLQERLVGQLSLAS